MNWLKKIIADDALPFELNDDIDYYGGISRVDNLMTEETARRIKEQYPSIQYKGHGVFGLATQIVGDHILKFTDDHREKYAAEQAMKSKPPCIVNIYKVELIQSIPNIWMIESDLVKEVPKSATNLIDSLRYHVSKYEKGESDFLDAEKAYDYIIEQYSVHFYEVLMKYYHMYMDMVKCLWQHRYSCFDAHSGNIGIDKNDKFVLFDLGSSKRRLRHGLAV